MGAPLNSIPFIVAWVLGCTAGLLIVDRYQQGLDPSLSLPLLVLGLACVPAMLLNRKSKRLVFTALCLSLFLFGVARALSTHPLVTENDLAYYNSSSNSPPLQVWGVVAAEPVAADKTQRV